jgi:hypothetical protein
MTDPTERQIATLRAVAAGGGFQSRVDDGPAAEECCWKGWLLAEGDSGYGLTMDGRAMMRRLF